MATTESEQLTWHPDGERLRSITVHRHVPFLGTHTQINAITFTFESGETKMWGKAGRGAQGDVLDLADGEYLVRVAGRCDEARPRPNGTLVSVTLTTSRYRELTSG